MSARAVRTLTVGSKFGDSFIDPPEDGLLPPGTKVGEYVIKRHLADGGMASVYEAVHPLIGKRAAVKVLSGALAWNEAIIQRFVREARAVNEIEHPNIVDIFAFGQLPDRRNYLVMELLVGETLAQRMGRSALEAAEVYETLIQICDALDATHEHHIAHLDLKPENVFLVPARRGPPLVKLLDFGIAELIDPASEATRSHLDHVFRGTPAYASPEQARDLPELDWRSDIYSLGVVAYELLVGRRPFIAESPIAILTKHVNQEPPRPSAFGVTLEPEVETLLFEMLAKPADLRPTAAEVRSRLGALHHVAESARKVEVQLGGAPSRKGRRAGLSLWRWPTTAVLGAVGAVGFMLAMSTAWSNGPRHSELVAPTLDSLGWARAELPAARSPSSRKRTGVAGDTVLDETLQPARPALATTQASSPASSNKLVSRRVRARSERNPGRTAAALQATPGSTAPPQSSAERTDYLLDSSGQRR